MNVDSMQSVICNQKFCFQALEAEKESTKTRSIGIAFVTFANLDDARKVNKRKLFMLCYVCSINVSKSPGSVVKLRHPTTHR